MSDNVEFLLDGGVLVLILRSVLALAVFFPSGSQARKVR